MRSFVECYKQDWDELDGLVRRAGRWSHSLTAAERERLDELYRRTTVHLARATSRTTDTQLIAYLNSLTAAAHSVIYLPPRESILRRVGRFAVEGFGRAIARSWRQQLLSAVLVVGGAIIGYAAAMSDPLVANALWSSEDSRQPGSTPEQLLSVLRHGREEAGGEKFAFASFLFQHNLKVAVLAMATGVLAAVPTVFLMILNGMLLGVFAAIHYQAGIEAEMWAWILPHGVTELGAIILCGGVGLMLGQAIVQPGAVTRRESLRRVGAEAARVCAGAAGMLVLAAIVESYVRQSYWSTAARLSFAAATAVFWVAYIAHGVYRESPSRKTGLDIASASNATKDSAAVVP